MQLKPIEHKRIADHVFDQLQELILTGEFREGDKILSERELANAFQVSRITVRDAVGKLAGMGMLEKRQGQGTFVSRTSGKTHAHMIMIMDSQNATMQDLLELCMGFECNAAALAAQRARQSDIAFMDKCIKESESEMRRAHLGSACDTRFHMTIAQANNNPLQVFVMKRLYEFLTFGIKENIFAQNEKSQKFETIQQQHRNIMNAIKAHDPMRAYRANKLHIEFVIQNLVKTEKVATR